MTRKTRIGAVHIAALAALVALGFSGESMAQSTSKPYGCACLHNTKVDGTINYRYKWGNKDWKTASLQKGTNQTMCWSYKDAPKSPELTFQLDADMTSGKDWKVFTIARGQSSDVNCGSVPAMAHYHVGYVKDSNKKRVMIYDGKE